MWDVSIWSWDEILSQRGCSGRPLRFSHVGIDSLKCKGTLVFHWMRNWRSIYFRYCHGCLKTWFILGGNSENWIQKHFGGLPALQNATSGGNGPLEPHPPRIDRVWYKFQIHFPLSQSPQSINLNYPFKITKISYLIHSLHGRIRISNVSKHSGGFEEPWRGNVNAVYLMWEFNLQDQAQESDLM